MKMVEMLALGNPVVPQRPRLSQLKSTNRIRLRRPTRRVKVQAALPDSDLVNYAAFQLASWVMPMAIAGRLLKMEWSEISVGLVALGVTKTFLSASGIIHY